MADLVVTITESVTLNGAARGSSNALTVSGVNDIVHRIVTCPDDVPLKLATFKSTVGAAVAENLMDIDLVKYIRVTNLDTTNPVVLNLAIDIGDGTDGDDGAATIGVSIEVEAGKSFIMGSPHSSILADDDAATKNVSNVALMDLRSIHVDPVSEAVKVEVFIASA